MLADYPILEKSKESDTAALWVEHVWWAWLFRGFSSFYFNPRLQTENSRKAAGQGNKNATRSDCDYFTLVIALEHAGKHAKTPDSLCEKRSILIKFFIV